jgi:hypothetical protein
VVKARRASIQVIRCHQTPGSHAMAATIMTLTDEQM